MDFSRGQCKPTEGEISNPRVPKERYAQLSLMNAKVSKGFGPAMRTYSSHEEAMVLIVVTGGDFYSNNDVIIPKNGKQIEIFQQKPLITICLKDFGTIPLPYN